MLIHILLYMILQYLNYTVVLEFVSISLLNYGNKYHRILRVLQETNYILESTICLIWIKL